MTRDAKDHISHEVVLTDGPPPPVCSPPSLTKRPGFVERYLDPASRLGEVLFGLIMVLSMTLTAEVAAEGHAPARALLFAAIGCNIAWGIIDAFMYLMHRLVTQGESVRVARIVRQAPSREAAIQAVRDQLGEHLEPLLPPADHAQVYDQIHRHLLAQAPMKATLTREDFFGALACFWLVFFSCLPAAIPFLVVADPGRALRLSNLLLLVMLFLVGYRWGEYSGTNRFAAGFVSLAAGLLLVGIAILLGG